MVPNAALRWTRRLFGLMMLLVSSPSAGATLPQSIGQASADDDSATIAIWLESGGNVDAQDEFGQTMMYLAAGNNRISVVNYLLSRHANINLPTSNGVTPLHTACNHGYSDIIRLLVEAGANVSAEDSQHRDALQWALFSTDTTVFQLLLDNGADFSHLNNQGQTAADAAAFAGKVSFLQFFLTRGYPLNGFGRREEVTPMQAAWDSKRMIHYGIDTDMSGIESNWQWHGAKTFVYLLEQGALIEWLNLACYEPWQRAIQFDVPELAVMKLNAGFTINTPDSLGRHPLLVCAKFNSASTAKLLIEQGADPNVRGQDGSTPMVSAAQSDAPDVVKLLIDSGISVNSSSAEGTPLLVEALRHGAFRSAEMLLKYAADRRVVDTTETALLTIAVSKSDTGFVARLLSWGFDPNRPCPGKQQPLHIAAQSGNGAICKLLIEAGADPNARDINGATPLTYTFTDGEFRRRMDALQTLMKMGANINYQWGGGNTPLKLAVLYQDIEFTRQLLENGAMPNLMDSDGLTALGYCRGDSSVRMAEMLFNFGADTNAWAPFNGKALAAAARLRDVKLLDYLIGKGFTHHLNDDKFKLSPLYLAVNQGDTAITRRLLQAGADPNRGLLNEQSIWTNEWIFNIAAVRGDTSIVRILIEGGIKVNLGISYLYSRDWHELLELVLEVRRRRGDEPLITECEEYYITESAGLFWAAWYNSFQCAELLLEAGANPNFRDRQQQTPLWWAVNAPEGYTRSNKSKPEVVDVLLRYGANPNQTDIAGNNLLCFSCDVEADWMVSRLLKAGVDANSKWRGNSALYFAVRKNNLQIAKMLIDKGAEVNAAEPGGQTPLSLARSRQFNSMAELLLKSGANR
jgi:cytohesin